MANAVLRIKHGSTGRKIWRYKNPDGSLMDLTGSEFELTIRGPGGTMLIHKRTIDSNGLVVDVPTSRVIWTPTTAETRLIPLGRVGSYDIERRFAGGEYPRGGMVEGVGGANVDG